MDPYAPLFSILRPDHEHCKIALECLVPEATTGAGGKTATFSDLAESRGSLDFVSETTNSDIEQKSVEKGAATSPSLDSSSSKQARIIALVTNVDQGYEEACIFALQRRRRDPKKAKICYGLPILPGLEVRMRQVERSNLNSNGVAKSVQSEAGAATSLMQVDMTLAGKTLSAVSDDVNGLRDLVTVVREAVTRAEKAANEDQENVKHSHEARQNIHQHTHHPHLMHLHPDSKGSSSKTNSHKWVEYYMDVDWAQTNERTPIFSRFTTSSFLPRRAERPRAPSPAEGEVRISFGTYNVNGQLPTHDDQLGDWLHVKEDDPDILVVGLQEADSSSLSYVVWTSKVEIAWNDAIERCMGRSIHEYTKLAVKQLVGVMLFIFVKPSLLPRISSPSASSVGVGFGGWGANKGAVAVRFVLDGSSVCFVASHLSAFSTPEARERRRWDQLEICRRLKFLFEDPKEMQDDVSSVASTNEKASKDDMTDSRLDALHTKGEDVVHSAEAMLRRQLNRASILSADPAESRGGDVASAIIAQQEQFEDRQIAWQQQTILDHDVVFWGGDLNFRIELDTFEVKRLIRRGQFESTLLKFDQLRSELEAKSCFQGFKEQKIDFAPTYKFDRGTDTYDTSEKHRCPAWTDRVLWRVKADVETSSFDLKDKLPRSKIDVQPISYESTPSIRFSDHKPVLATFLLRLS